MDNINISNRRKRTIVFVGATNIVGTTAIGELTRRGHKVRGLSRKMGIDLTDQEALRRTFAGADAAYIMIPFNTQAEDLHSFERKVAQSLIDAISASEIRRVVLLSGLNAHLKKGTSLGAAEMEDRLEALRLPELVFLRAGWFNENFVKGMGFLEQSKAGAFATPFRGDIPMPLIASRDVGEYA